MSKYEIAELLKDKALYDPSKVSDKVLFDDHRIAHSWWTQILRGQTIKGWSKEDVYNTHKLIATDIERRNLEHKTPLPSQLQSQDQILEKEGIKGPKIYLPSILSAFQKDFVIAEDFVSIVGGICNDGSTVGDIDIMLKTPEPKARSPLGKQTRLSISNAMKNIGIPEARLQFLYDELSENLTNHIHCYDLILRLNPKRELHAMPPPNANSSVAPFSFVTQPESLHGRFKEELCSPETVTEAIESIESWKDSIQNGLYVESKFDGNRIQIHKQNERIELWTDEKINVTSKLPSIVNAVKKIGHDFVAEGELELWQENEHKNKTEVTALINSKDISTNEPDTRVTLYDLMFIDGRDIHSLEFKERSSILQSKFSTSAKLKISIPRLVKSMDDLKKEVIKAAKLPGSEGAIIKMSDYVYPLKKYTSQMMKFKNEFSINVKIMEVYDVKDSKAKSYLTAIKDGQKLIPTGRTHNTDIIAQVGSNLRIVFAELSKYVDPDTKQVWYNLWSPRVIEKSIKADSSQTANLLVEKSGGQIADKKFPARYKNLLQEESYITEFLNNALLWETEEFDFGLKNDWIRESLIPEQLAKGACSELRNADNFILKKEVMNSALVCLRNEENKIISEKNISLVIT